jgi:MSHA pilin protein MshA
MMTKRKKNEKGFTLIELIMVIVILGIIAGVAVPKFIGLSASARLSAARGVGAAISGTCQSEHAAYLLNATAYDADTILANTQFSGGVSVAHAAGTYTFATGPSTYTWTYNARVNDVGAFITEDSGSDFP